MEQRASLDQDGTCPISHKLPILLLLFTTHNKLYNKIPARSCNIFNPFLSIKLMFCFVFLHLLNPIQSMNLVYAPLNTFLTP